MLSDEYDYDEVIGVTVDVGQPEAEFEEAEATADALDLEHHVVDAREAFADQCLEAVRANATYQDYPLGTALARPVIAERILEVAREHDCGAVAHGATGKGNDQLRFEAVWRGSALEVVAPIRERGLTREWEQEYAAERDLPVEGGDEGAYSIDTNLWTRSVEGSELERPDHVPGEEIYEWTDAPGSETDSAELEITFEAGYPVALEGEELESVDLTERLNERAGTHGVGRTGVMEDRMLGLKVRENYEHPAATVLLEAHEALENLVLTKAERAFKRQVDHEWAEHAYEGLLDAPLMDALESFVETTNERVTGTVTVRLEGGRARAVARDSASAVYSADAVSFDTETVGEITQDDATGIAKYHGFQERLANTVLEGGSDHEQSESDEQAVADGGAEPDDASSEDA